MIDWRCRGAGIWTGILLAALSSPAADFDLNGQLQPKQALPVHLQGATTPFSATTTANVDGRFHFRKLSAGAYVLMVGTLQRTVEVGPSLADSKDRISITINLSDAGVDPNFSARNRVSIRELSVSKGAQREYDTAEEALGRRNVSAAVEHLKRAVALAPHFSAAWNHLGTIAYQMGQYPEAESDFRKGLEANPEAYSPLVNLGGVLLNLGKWSEALDYNRIAVRRSPNDALANSQLGMSYFYSGQLDSAEKYLAAAKQLDAAHFSHPQLLLAEIHLRRNEPEAAASELQDLVTRHPDLPNASKIRDAITRLRAATH